MTDEIPTRKRKQMKRKILLSLLAVVFLTAAQLGESQSSGKIIQIGYLGNDKSSSRLDIAGKDFLEELRKHGWIEGQNIIVEQRYWENRVDRVREQAAEMVRLKVNIIVTDTGTAARAAKEFTTTIPIVMVSSADAVTQRLAISLARPGGNVTGLTTISSHVIGKQLELMKEAFPNTSRVAFLRCGSRTNLSNPAVAKKQWNEAKEAARGLKIQLSIVPIQGSEEMVDALATVTRERTDALLVSDCVRVRADEFIELAAKSRLPAIYPFSDFVKRGGLMSYGADETQSFRRAAQFVDKILKGANPAELPVEQPTKFELVINLKTARHIGVMIPPQVLMWADQVIK